MIGTRMGEDKDIDKDGEDKDMDKDGEDKDGDEDGDKDGERTMIGTRIEG